MNVLTAVCTDIGTKKDTNQDSLCVKVAETDLGKVVMAVICDGMGGLAKGEIASASVVEAFSRWYDNELPLQLQNYKPDEIRARWEEIIPDMNLRIAEYEKSIGVQLGTTLSVLLLIDNKALFIGHVGDSRVYEIDDREAKVLTTDQTVVANEVRLGRMTPEQAAVDPRRSVLLQCIGASRVVNPDYLMGTPAEGKVYMLCSDGFRHLVTPAEIASMFAPRNLVDEADMEERITALIEENKKRGETDNITALLLKLE